MRLQLLAVIPLMSCAACVGRVGNTAPGAPHLQPIIDVHLHVGLGDTTPEAVLRSMDEHGVVLALLSGPDTGTAAAQRRLAPTQFVTGAAFPCTDALDPRLRACFPETQGWPDLDWMRREYSARRMGFMGELNFVYYGISPTDARLAPYWAIAEELDVPAGVHLGPGPPPQSRAPGCCPHFDGALGNPDLLRPILRRHPKLRVWLMHAGGLGFVDEAIALMRDHPNVYADMSVVNSELPVALFETNLKRLLDAGLADRIMFGSDNRPYARIIQRMEAVPFLTDAQKRAIYYDNAARFLRLSPEEVARHQSGR